MITSDSTRITSVLMSNSETRVKIVALKTSVKTSIGHSVFLRGSIERFFSFRC